MKRWHIVFPSADAIKQLCVVVHRPQVVICQIGWVQLFETANPPVAFTVGTVTPSAVSRIFVFYLGLVLRARVDLFA